MIFGTGRRNCRWRLPISWRRRAGSESTRGGKKQSTLTVERSGRLREPKEPLPAAGRGTIRQRMQVGIVQSPPLHATNADFNADGTTPDGVTYKTPSTISSPIQKGGTQCIISEDSGSDTESVVSRPGSDTYSVHASVPLSFDGMSRTDLLAMWEVVRIRKQRNLLGGQRRDVDQSPRWLPAPSRGHK